MLQFLVTTLQCDNIRCCVQNFEHIDKRLMCPHAVFSSTSKFQTANRHRLRIHRCATRGISCLTWMAWIRHTYAHFWQVQMQDFIRN